MNPQQNNPNMMNGGAIADTMSGQMGGQVPGRLVGQPQMMGQPQILDQTQMMTQPQVPVQPQVMMPGQAQVVPGQVQTIMPETQTVPGQSQVLMPNQVPGQNLAAANLGATAVAANQKRPVSPNRDVPTSTQATLLISELRDNVVIMKDGSFRAVVACKSINFDLMSDMEREGVEYSYQNFLNSLKFTTQILIRSQRVDIGPYLERLQEIRRNNDNMLLGVLMDDYINFVDILSQEANIMDKSFFVVIPYYTSAEAEKALEQTKNFFKSFSKAKAPAVTKIDRATYNKAMTEITNRVDSVMSGLFQIGIHSVRLNTKELAELYYNFNNPDTAVREPLVDFSKLATMYVRKGEEPKNG